jgi:hypothetical protein
VIVCGWCGKPTLTEARCAACGHVDPERPWTQRNEIVPRVSLHDGRPPITTEEARRRLAALGPAATVEQLAEHFGVDARTVRRWRAKVSG